jgi:hypothetical protein
MSAAPTVERGIAWLRSMLVMPDGSQGIYERWRINLRRINPWVRPDCCIESGRAFYAAGERDIGVNLARYVCALQERGGGFADGSFPFYIFRPFTPDEPDIGRGFGIPDLPNFRWHNDHGKIAEYLLWFYRQTRDPDFARVAERTLAYLLRAQDDDGAFTRTPRGDNPHFRTADFVAWGAAALSCAHTMGGSKDYADGARKALGWLARQMHPSGRMLTGWETARFEPWRPVASETAVGLHAFVEGRWAFPGETWLEIPLHTLARTLVAWQHANGAIRNSDAASRDAALQNDPDMTDLVYVDGYALIDLQAAYSLTRESAYMGAAQRLSDFLIAIQCRDESPLWDGAWRGSYHLERRTWYGSADPGSELEEGGMNAVYTGWCAAPILYGLMQISSPLPIDR